MSIVTLIDGAINGGDLSVGYSGSYIQDGDRFTADVVTRRLAQEQPPLFGLDSVTPKLSRTSKHNTAACTGFAEEAPGIPFEVVLVRMEGDPD